MKLLEEISSFPAATRERLESEFGIETAEAFYAHAVQDADALGSALHLSGKELDKLVRMVEGHLEAGFAERCRQPLKKHPRGLRID